MWYFCVKRCGLGVYVCPEGAVWSQATQQGLTHRFQVNSPSAFWQPRVLGRHEADALKLSGQSTGALSPLADSEVALAGSAQNSREGTLTVFCPAFRFTASKSQLAVVWSSCGRSPLAKDKHWPTYPKRRNCWRTRRLP